MFEQLKSEINKLSSEQQVVKVQRKTVNFTGIRTMESAEAVTIHQSNRYTLRHLYIVYGFLRGKTLEQIEPNSKTPISNYLIEKLMEKYKMVEELV